MAISKETKKKLLDMAWRLENASHGCDTSQMISKEDFLKKCQDKN